MPNSSGSVKFNFFLEPLNRNNNADRCRKIRNGALVLLLQTSLFDSDTCQSQRFDMPIPFAGISMAILENPCSQKLTKINDPNKTNALAIRIDFGFDITSFLFEEGFFIDFDAPVSNLVSVMQRLFWLPAQPE